MTIESTDKLLKLGETPVRLWTGKTSDGTPVHVLVAAVGVDVDLSADDVRSALAPRGPAAVTIEAPKGLSHPKYASVAGMVPVAHEFLGHAHCASVAALVLLVDARGGLDVLTHACDDTGSAGPVVRRLEAQLVPQMRRMAAARLAGESAPELVLDLGPADRGCN